ncbi:serine/threonine protein kinase [Lysobacter sp. 5GHs7-4]|uniref:serine/threonine-protein kinase n=1 Tax=Lysobacter sp. 5GHs7-4 TaxID=2904253 RepID=UPI001E4BBAE8|nr:serine/threonine-protein kinase [Lysobacter sp. 5GHs7-4]UHQ24094.1 serine/threonine protein kinase [Lysobacter sp. 5GHs7-4]
MNDPTARALALFDDYIELSAEQRGRALEALARDDPPAHAALLALLQADTDRGTVLERLPAELLAERQPPPDRWPDADAPDPRLGQRLGAWRIDRLIAAGGMGAVYEAHRDDGQYQQRVALKCVRAELATSDLVAAFFDERNHLARLDHPGIAGIVDGGVAADGQPWFAMRYIDGVAIDRWCDARKAGLAQRVDLLIQAAQALAHAHAQGLLHGDIKPSNLLVTADGRVQLVDFGISATFNALQTDRLSRVALTPDYAAPESREPGRAGPTIDLYALGVLTYRLLSAQWPSPLHTLGALTPAVAAGPAEPMERLLLQAAAPPRVALERGQASVAALARALSGDLSAIARKAVAAQPQDRYPSASAYADDLQRWREHRPVQARPVGWPTRMRLRLRRHRGASALALALVLVLALGLGWSWREHRQAAREAQAVRAVSDLFASTLGAATLSGLGSTPFSSRNLLTRTESDLRKLDLRQHPLLHAQSLATLARSYAVIGDYQHAERLADEASASLDGHSDDQGYVYATRLSLLNLQSRYAEAAQLARARLAALAGRDDALARQSSATIGVELSQAQWGLGDPQAALRSLDQAQAQAQALGAGHDELQAQLLMLRARYRARMFLLRDAQADLERAIVLAGHGNPILADDAREQWLTILARYRRSSDLALAHTLLRDRRATLGDRHPKTGRAWILLGYAQHMMDSNKVDAQKNMLAGQALIEAAYGRDHPEYAQSLVMMTSVMARESRDNVQALREALRICEASLGPRHETTLYVRRVLASRLHDLSPSILRPDDHKEAEALFEENLRIKRQAGIPAPWETLLLAHSLQLHGETGDLPRIEALLRDSRAQGQRYFGPQDSYRGIVDIFWIALRYQQGHRAEADQAFGRVIDRYRDDTTYFAQLFRHDAWLYRAMYAYERCDVAQAQAYLGQALASERERLGPTHFATRDTLGFLTALRRDGRLSNTTGAQVPNPTVLAEAQRLHLRDCRKRAG